MRENAHHDNGSQKVSPPPSRNMKARRISASVVRNALQAAEVEFEWCQQSLAAMKNPGDYEGVGHAILDFQPRLRDAISALETTYRRIKREEKRLIANKQGYNEAWFKQRMGKLASYTKSLTEGLAIGRALGDGFAWQFYQQDRDLIDEHLKLQRQTLLPPAIGALGEKLTLENMRGWDEHLLIYHGTTTFLRMGDFSLVDLKSGRVSCIGELKTQRVDEQQVSVSISLIGSEGSRMPKLPEFKKRKAEEELEPAPPLPSRMRSRLKRQIREIHEAMERAHEGRAEESISNRSKFYFVELEELVRRSHTKSFEFAKAGDGLLFGALRLRAGTTLASKLMGEGFGSFDRAVADTPASVLKILSPDIADNSISMCSLGGPDYLPTDRSCPPFLAWSVDPDVLADIMFGRVIVVTFFNRAHLIAKLRERGFEVETDDKGKLLRAHKLVEENKQIALEHFDQILGLVERSLMTEESVIAMIDETISASMALGKDGLGRVEFRTRIA